ncbi:DNA repair protein RecO [Fusobacterium sp. MFO224]|uniref:DNA repair protein RecO n=1 Tax=Fusobacterium sp. MFO224 TaxID=3378070 RepID=UPI003853F75B
MTELIKLEGIVIKRQDFNESDCFLKIFTPTLGKVDVLIKGIKKSKKRDKIAADVLSYCKIVGYKKKLNFIGSSIELVNDFEFIRKDIDKIGNVLYMFSILNNVLNDFERNNDLFQLVCKSLKYINEEKEKYKYTTLLLFFMNRVIDSEGVSYIFQDGKYFSIKESYIGKAQHADSFLLSDEEYKVISAIKNHKIRELLKDTINIKSLFNILKIYEKYLNYHLEINLNVKNYILEEIKW